MMAPMVRLPPDASNMPEKKPARADALPAGLTKWLCKSPILFYRLGLGFLVGQIFMLMTTIGRKSGQPRRTAIEFHEFTGRNYVFSSW